MGSGDQARAPQDAHRHDTFACESAEHRRALFVQAQKLKDKGFEDEAGELVRDVN